jgi:hypothetical protein
VNARDEARAALDALDSIRAYDPDDDFARYAATSNVVAALRALLDDPVPADEREALEEWSFVHRPVLSMRDGSIASCKCLDRVFINGQEDWDQHVADSLIAAGFRRQWPITDTPQLRSNPPMPSHDELHAIWLSGDLQCVWRHGCDAGMVAP